MLRSLIVLPVGDGVCRLTVAKQRDDAQYPVSALTIVYEGETPFAAFAEDADAQLFAAAPDILAALEACAPVLESAGEFFNGVSGALALARAAIAKAKGEKL